MGLGKTAQTVVTLALLAAGRAGLTLPAAAPPAPPASKGRGAGAGSSSSSSGAATAATTVTLAPWAASPADTWSPFLILCPNQVLSYWAAEVAGWGGGVLWPLVYAGSAAARRVAHAFELGAAGGGSAYRCNVLIVPHSLLKDASPAAAADRALLARVPARVVVVDEAHHFANPAAAATRALGGFRLWGLLLLTGTPLTTKVESLFSLLQLLQPGAHGTADGWNERFGCLDARKGDATAAAVSTGERKRREAARSELNGLLRRVMLLRSQAVISALLPPKSEVRVDTAMTPLQRFAYTAISLAELRAQAAAAAAGDESAARRALAALRTGGSAGRGETSDRYFAALSPLLVPQVVPLIERQAGLSLAPALEDAVRSNANLRYGRSAATEALPEADEADLACLLVETSAKFSWVDATLPGLLAAGHRVLLFSRFTMVLDLCEVLLRGRLGLAYERVDGSVSTLERQARIDRFNGRPTSGGGGSGSADDSDPGAASPDADGAAADPAPSPSRRQGASAGGPLAGDPRPHVFLLTTKAGGQGINLQTADTVRGGRRM